VDDDQNYRELLKVRLQNAGYTTAEACDGMQAIKILKVESYDVILLDLNMPNMGGYEVLEWLKQNKNTRDCNVIVLTADSIRDSVVTSLTLGAKDFIAKSVSNLELLTRVRYFCEIKTLEKKINEKISDEELAKSVILLVDDEQLSLDLTARRIEKFGFKVLRASNGEQAISAVIDNDIQLVLLDINMPEIDGYEVLKQIRRIRSKEELAVVMVTAVEEPDIVIDCINAGANDYIMKPFHPTELIARVNTVLRFSLLLNKEHLRRLKHESLSELGDQIRNTET